MDSFMNFFLSKRIIGVKSRYNNNASVFNGALSKQGGKYSLHRSRP
jgi:hypothetical protein